MKYTLLRSRRRTVALQVNKEGLTVKAPLTLSKREIDRFVTDHEGWIKKQLKKVREEESLPKLTDSERETVRERAKEILPKRVRHYAEKLGLNYGNVTVRLQKTRWGSCTSKGNLSLNAMLVLLPEEVMDAVIVHELCHLVEMNHQENFYKLVRSAYPNYDKCNKWLKDNGRSFLSRIGD